MYTVKFKIKNKGFSVKVDAKSEDDAKYMVYGLLEFISFEKEKSGKSSYDLPPGFDEFFGGFKRPS